MCQRRRAEQLRRTAARRSVGGLGIHGKVKTPLACRNQGAKWQKIKPAARSELGSIWPCAKDVLDSLQRIPSVLQKTINLACAFWRPMFLFHDKLERPGPACTWSQNGCGACGTQQDPLGRHLTYVHDVSAHLQTEMNLQAETNGWWRDEGSDKMRSASALLFFASDSAGFRLGSPPGHVLCVLLSA